jgi:hypothetical protein
MPKKLAAVVVALVATQACTNRTGGDSSSSSSSGGGSSSSSSSGMTSGGGSTSSSSSSGDAGPQPKTHGESCGGNAECESNLCFNPYAALGVGTGYCADACADVADCSGFNDGYVYACVRAGGVSRCLRECANGYGCKDGDLCAQQQQVSPGNVRDVCVDFRDDTCTADRDCPTGEYCFLAGDNERVVPYCFQPKDPAGNNITRKTVGEACDPRTRVLMPCALDADCPSTWTCVPRQDGRRVCQAPVPEYCTTFCTMDDVCTGYCDTQSDCPADWGCMPIRQYYFNELTGSPVDDVAGVTNYCFPVKGSNTPCTGAAGCTYNPDAGITEACRLLAVDGGAATHCLEAPPAMVRNGGRCGDDPMTAQVEPDNCLGMCQGGVCGELCVEDSDCPATMECASFQGQAGLPRRACALRAQCAGDGVDGGCAAGEVCGFTLTNGGNRRYCQAPNGALPAGATCALGEYPFFPYAERCQSVCEQTQEAAGVGRCLGLCAQDADCPVDHICATLTFTLDNNLTPNQPSDDVRQPLTRCFYNPGSHTPCTTNTDCTVTGEHCAVELDAQGAFRMLCSSRRTGTATLGQACPMGTECGENLLCLDTWRQRSQYCSKTCTVDGDCSSGLLCRKFTGFPLATPPRMCLDADDPRWVP